MGRAVHGKLRGCLFAWFLVPHVGARCPPNEQLFLARPCDTSDEMWLASMQQCPETSATYIHQGFSYHWGNLRALHNRHSRTRLFDPDALAYCVVGGRRVCCVCAMRG